MESDPVEPDGPAAYALRLPGRNLYLTPLLKQKKFRNFKLKIGAMTAFNELQEDKLGTLEEMGAGKGTQTASIMFYIFLINVSLAH